MARFGCGTQVSRSETPTSLTGSAQRDPSAPSRHALAARVLGRFTSPRDARLLLACKELLESQGRLPGAAVWAIIVLLRLSKSDCASPIPHTGQKYSSLAAASS